MANQYINKVILGEETLIDISDTQAVASDVASGKKFYLKSGAPATGTNTYDADTSDATASAGEILATKTAYVSGAKVTGSMANRGSVTGTITTKAQQYTVQEGEVGKTLGLADMIINFFTKPDFPELWSRKAILPLIVFAVLFGFGIQMAGGKKTMTAKLLSDLTECIMKVVKIVTYYAPIGFFGFFAYLVATYGPELIGDYSRTLIIYYVLCFAYMFVFFPIYARFGGGKGAVKVMLRHLFKPAAVSFGTCSSVATIPTNMEEAESTGISKDVADIVMPLGATMHMDGSAMSAIIKVAFLFGIFGKDFGTGEAILAIIVAVFSSVAMSGIPGGGGTGELVLCTVFFPDQLAIAYPIAIALGNLVDPPATMVNAAGDYVVSYIVERFITGKNWLQKKLNK